MAGQPQQRAVEIVLSRKAIAELGKDASVLDYVCHRLEAGETLLDLTAEINDEQKVPVGRGAITAYLKKRYPADQLQARLGLARSLGAHALVEEAQQLVDDAREERDAIAKAKSQAELRLWRAERYNKRELGAAPSTVVAIQAGALHLDALRMRSLPHADASNAPLATLPTGHNVQSDVIDVDVTVNESV